jgi:hypothetical protein
MRSQHRLRGESLSYIDARLGKLAKVRVDDVLARWNPRGPRRAEPG